MFSILFVNLPGIFSIGGFAFTALLSPGPCNTGGERPKHNVSQYGSVLCWTRHTEVALKHNSKEFANRIKAEFR